MGVCTECSNETGSCNLCEEDFQRGSMIFCFKEKYHFCTGDCLLMWLKEQMILREATYKKEEDEL